MDTSKPTTRPDLFANASNAPDSGNRILANLEHGSSAAQPGRALAARLRPSRIVAMLGVLAMAMGVLAWLTLRSLGEPQLGKQFAISERNQAVTESPQEVERLAAAIVNEPLQPAPAAPAKEDRAAVAEQIAESAPRQEAAPPQATRGARQPAPWGAAPVRPAARSVAAAPAHAAPRKPAPAKAAVVQVATADNDVALLAALVAHANSQPQAYGRNRDVVVRTDSDSTEALLARCQRLGAAEGELCRARICSGQWAHEAACRAGAAD